MVDKPVLDVNLMSEANEYIYPDNILFMKQKNAVEKKYLDQKKPYDSKGAWNDYESSEEEYRTALKQGIPGARRRKIDLETYGDASRFKVKDVFQDKTGEKLADQRGCKVLVTVYESKVSGYKNYICVEQSPEEALEWVKNKKK